MERNRNGIASTFFASTKFPINATLVRVRPMAPARVCSPRSATTLSVKRSAWTVGQSSFWVAAEQNTRATALVEAAVKNSAPTSTTVRERSARLYTGNFIPL
jgi:hypothetical protein